MACCVALRQRRRQSGERRMGALRSVSDLELLGFHDCGCAPAPIAEVSAFSSWAVAPGGGPVGLRGDHEGRAGPAPGRIGSRRILAEKFPLWAISFMGDPFHEQVPLWSGGVHWYSDAVHQAG